MLARLNSMATVGIDARRVHVEVAVSDRRFKEPVIVGLPDAAVRESVQRIISAFNHVGLRFPDHQVTVNLAPADLRKEGPSFDLPIAAGVLIATQQMPWPDDDQTVLAGELALDGRTRSVRGGLSMALAAREAGFKRIILPPGSAQEAAVVRGIDVLQCCMLMELLSHAQEVNPLPTVTIDVDQLLSDADRAELDFADVRGQEAVKRAITIAAAGAHNVLMIGPPGSGKTMLAKRLPTVLPPLTLQESLEATRIYSVRGETSLDKPLIVRRPVRSPHHTASTPALVGGGMGTPRPGEVSLAHHGVLFLDEFPEFSRHTLEALRQPMEDGVVTVARAYGTIRFPAQFMLVAAMNPSVAGYGQNGTGQKRVSARAQSEYMSRISGPLVDRIDIHIEVPAVPTDQLRSRRDGTTSAQMRAAVVQARDRQRQRFGPETTTLNSRMSAREIRTFCPLDQAGETVLRQAITELGLSARAHDKVLRVSRTIADLAARDTITAADVSEAVLYRRLDRGR